MNIKFVPQDKNHPANKAILTNVGEFRPDQSLSMQPHQEKEARRLVENGDFVEVPDAPDAASSAIAAPEVAETEVEVEEEITDKPAKSKK